MICPVCRQGLNGETPTYCTPLSCPAWHTEAVFDHASREWVPVDSDGYALDGVPVGTPR